LQANSSNAAAAAAKQQNEGKGIQFSIIKIVKAMKQQCGKLKMDFRLLLLLPTLLCTASSAAPG